MKIGWFEVENPMKINDFDTKTDNLIALPYYPTIGNNQICIKIIDFHRMFNFKPTYLYDYWELENKLSI